MLLLPSTSLWEARRLLHLVSQVLSLDTYGGGVYGKRAPWKELDGLQYGCAALLAILTDQGRAVQGVVAQASMLFRREE